MSTREQEAAPKTYLNPTGKKWSHGLEIAEMENEISALRAELAAAREALAMETARLNHVLPKVFCACGYGDWHDAVRKCIDRQMETNPLTTSGGAIENGVENHEGQ